MGMFCKDLRNQAMKMINYEKKEMIPLTDKKTLSLIKRKKFVIYAKNNIFTDKNDENEFKLHHKVRDHVNTQENLEVLLIIFVT